MADVHPGQSGGGNALHRPRCCDDPTPEAVWGMGTGENNFITVWCTSCHTDLVTLDPPSGGDRGVYIGLWHQGDAA